MTIQDIANALNLSIATVSKALNGSTDVAGDTKKLICDYAQSVGYVSRKARTINGRIAILWGKGIKENGALSEIANAFQNAAEQARYVVVEDAVGEGFDLNEYIGNNRFFGALLLDVNFRSPVYAQLKQTRYPIVLVDNYITHPLVSGVGSDNIHAVEEAVDYLVSLGHRDIAFLGGETESLVGAERLAGYILGLAKSGIEYRYDLTYFGDFSKKAGRNAADYFLQSEKRFTAIVCAADAMAHGFIERMREAGIRIPDDISVIGYDDVRSETGDELDLTTIRQDFGKTGELGFTALECLMKGQPSQRSTVGYTFIPRRSTRKLER